MVKIDDLLSTITSLLGCHGFPLHYRQDSEESGHFSVGLGSRDLGDGQENCLNNVTEILLKEKKKVYQE